MLDLIVLLLEFSLLVSQSQNLTHLAIMNTDKFWSIEMTAGSESNDQQKVDISKSFDPASLKIPANRHGEEEEMAATVLYL